MIPWYCVTYTAESCYFEHYIIYNWESSGRVFLLLCQFYYEYLSKTDAEYNLCKSLRILNLWFFYLCHQSIWRRKKCRKGQAEECFWEMKNFCRPSRYWDIKKMVIRSYNFHLYRDSPKSHHLLYERFTASLAPYRLFSWHFWILPPCPLRRNVPARNIIKIAQSRCYIESYGYLYSIYSFISFCFSVTLNFDAN